MKHILVKFDQADQIINFVRIINRYSYDADVKCGSRVVDAKSDALLEEIAPYAA